MTEQGQRAGAAAAVAAARASASTAALECTGLVPARELLPATQRVLDCALAQAQRNWHSVGVSAGVVRDGALEWSGHVGSARLSPTAAATDDTPYLIGSVTKTFTAVLIMALRDEGRLDLEGRLDTYLPGTAHGALTLRQLLAHASGLQREPVGRVWESMEHPDADGLLAGVAQAEAVLTPHTAFHYSNLAYALLGQVVERLEGQRWAQVLQRRLLDPLRMGDTGLVPDPASRARGYHVHPFTGVAREEPRMTLRAGAPLGGLWSTVADLARYADFLATGRDDVLSADTLEEMASPQIMCDLDGWTRAYGLGLELSREGERVLVGHGGAMPGFLTGLRVSRAARTGVVVFANVTAGAEPGLLAATLLGAVLEEEPRTASPWRPSTPRPEWEPLLGSWWTEGTEVVLAIDGGELWLRVPGRPAAAATRFVPEGADRFRAVAGRERGELLEVDRSKDGAVRRLYVATYALTREPLSFGELR